MCSAAREPDRRRRPVGSLRRLRALSAAATAVISVILGACEKKVRQAPAPPAAVNSGLDEPPAPPQATVDAPPFAAITTGRDHAGFS